MGGEHSWHSPRIPWGLWEGCWDPAIMWQISVIFIETLIGCWGHWKLLSKLFSESSVTVRVSLCELSSAAREPGLESCLYHCLRLSSLWNSFWDCARSLLGLVLRDATCWGSEGSWIAKREELKSKAVTEASADPIRSSGAGERDL